MPYKVDFPPDCARIEAMAKPRETRHPYEGQKHLNPSDPLSVGYDLLVRREATGLSRTPVAEKAGISERTLFRWEMEGTTMANHERIVNTLNSVHYTPSGRPNVARIDSSELRKASSVDLASELLERARIFDNYTQMVEDLKNRMLKDNLGHYLPPGL